jgi:hypothetical protein
MALSYVLGFNPIWTAFDLVGRPAGSASLYSFHNLNPSVPFPIYIDASGSEQWTNPILFAENGQQGPFYFLFNDSFPEDTYFLELYDVDENLIWQVSNYFPGGGGGSVVTITSSIKNYTGNPVFWRFGGTPVAPNFTSSVFTNPANETVICPGNHAAIYTPDIYYYRVGGAPVDSITFTPFAAGDTPFLPDNTPEYYLRYNGLGSSGVTIKGIAYPIVSHVKTLENQPMTFSIWAKGNTGLQQLFIQTYQYTGTGSNTPTPTTPQTIQTIDLAPTTGVWTKTNVNFIVPSSAALVLGNNNNSAFYMIVGFPLNTACNIDLTNVRLYLGTVNPSDFDTYDQIDSIVNAPRTGDTRTSMNSFAPYGWVQMNDGTIGSPSSGATNRANFDTFYLYKLIWDATNTNPTTITYAPIQTSGGAVTTRGASADADFAANKRLQLLFALGRVFAGAGGAHPIGQPLGAETYQLLETDIAGHTHTVGGGGATAFRTVSVAPSTLFSAAAGPLLDGSAATTDRNQAPGANTSFSLLQPTTYMNVFIKL